MSGSMNFVAVLGTWVKYCLRSGT